MKINLLLIALVKTIGILLCGEILTTTLFSNVDMISLHFHIMIILFFCSYLNLKLIPYFIVIISFMHSLFSIEGWAISAVVGVILAFIIYYIKEVLDFSSYVSTILFVMLSQVVWFLLRALLLCVKFSSFDQFFSFLTQPLLSSFVLALVSPWIFTLLQWIWKSSGAIEVNKK